MPETKNHEEKKPNECEHPKEDIAEIIKEMNEVKEKTMKLMLAQPKILEMIAEKLNQCPNGEVKLSDILQIKKGTDKKGLDERKKLRTHVLIQISKKYSETRQDGEVANSLQTLWKNILEKRTQVFSSYQSLVDLIVERIKKKQTINKTDDFIQEKNAALLFAICNCEKDDLIQEGNIGLLMAIDTFDNSKGIKFITYAYKCILYRIIHFGKKTHKTALHSHEQPKIPKGAHQSLEPQEGNGNISSFELASVLEHILSQLEMREYLIIQRRFGLNGKGEMTLKELGECLKLTRERVRQIESRALRKLGKLLEDSPQATPSHVTLHTPSQ